MIIICGLLFFFFCILIVIGEDGFELLIGDLDFKFFMIFEFGSELEVVVVKFFWSLRCCKCFCFFFCVEIVMLVSLFL